MYVMNDSVCVHTCGCVRACLCSEVFVEAKQEQLERSSK